MRRLRETPRSKGNVQSGEVLAAGATIIAHEGGAAYRRLDQQARQLHLNGNTES